MIRSRKSVFFALCFMVINCNNTENNEILNLDLVGKSTSETFSDEKSNIEKEEEIQILFTVDLIEDLYFRFKRDGWTLLTEKSHVNVEKLNKGGVNLIFAAVKSGSGKNSGFERQIKKTIDLIKETNGKLAVVSDMNAAQMNKQKGVVSVMFLLEGAEELVSADQERLFDLKKQGLSIVGLVNSKGNEFADNVTFSKNPGGLTKKGVNFVQLCRDSTIAIDLTHASVKTFWDVFVDQGALAMVSHSAVRAIRENSRNLDDIQILAIARYGGIFGLVFNPDFLKPGNSQNASIDDLMKHLLHVKKIGAIDALSFGTDFGGIKPLKGISDISYMKDLEKRMEKDGFSKEEIVAVFGENFLRYFDAIEIKHGANEVGKANVLRPIEVECDVVIGDYAGVATRACNGYLLDDGPVLQPSARQKFRVRDMNKTPVKLEIFGEPNTPWQIEAQNLNGKVLVRRGVLLDEKGRGVLSMPRKRNLTRVFLFPTRPSRLFEAVIWGR